ncbi:MAG: hypothetical protein AAB527_01805 [Patescibacteria group bacterium]
MNREQPDLFPRPKMPAEEMPNEPETPPEISAQIQGARKKRYADKKAAEKAFVAGRRKIMGETKEGQKEAFPE